MKEKLYYPPEWEEITQEILKNGHICMVIGGVDTGKNTFITYLANLGLERKREVYIMDCDMGQAEIGPPTTIGIGKLKDKISSLTDIKPERLFFVGCTSPAKILPILISGIKKLLQFIPSSNEILLIINTTGLISNDLGKQLKYEKFLAIKPSHLVILQRREEIIHLYNLFKKERELVIFLLPAHPNAVSRSLESRKAYREKRYKEYFQTSKTKELSFSKINFSRTELGKGRRLNQNEKNFISKTIDDLIIYGENTKDSIIIVTVDPIKSNYIFTISKKFFGKNILNFTPDEWNDLLVGLADEDEVLIGLALIREINFALEKFILLTPVEDLEKVKIIQFSNFYLSLNPFKEELR